MTDEELGRRVDNDGAWDVLRLQRDRIRELEARGAMMEDVLASNALLHRLQHPPRPQLTEALAKAREEGRRAGLEEAAQAVERRGQEVRGADPAHVTAKMLRALAAKEKPNAED